MHFIALIDFLTEQLTFTWLNTELFLCTNLEYEINILQKSNTMKFLPYSKVSYTR